MAKFGDYDALGEVEGDELVVVRRTTPSAATRRVTVDDLAAYAVAESMVVVSHGSTAATARPDAAAVYWVGSVEPDNAEVHDLWYDTSA